MKTENKVLTLLEWRLKRRETVKERLKGFFKKFLAIGLPFDEAIAKAADSEKKDDYAADDFYSQPFTPERIVEWFEGWGHSPVASDAWLQNDNILILFDFYPSATVLTISETNAQKITFHLPHQLTLADFISDSGRAGILSFLTWNSKVVEENPFLKHN